MFLTRLCPKPRTISWTTEHGDNTPSLLKSIWAAVSAAAWTMVSSTTTGSIRAANFLDGQFFLGSSVGQPPPVRLCGAGGHSGGGARRIGVLAARLQATSRYERAQVTVLLLCRSRLRLPSGDSTQYARSSFLLPRRYEDDADDDGAWIAKAEHLCRYDDDDDDDGDCAWGSKIAPKGSRQPKSKRKSKPNDSSLQSRKEELKLLEQKLAQPSEEPPKKKQRK